MNKKQAENLLKMIKEHPYKNKLKFGWLTKHYFVEIVPIHRGTFVKKYDVINVYKNIYQWKILAKK